MKKLLHEKLREAAKTEADIRNYYPCVVAAKDLGAIDDTRYDTEVKLLNAIADEIEKYYIPRPRFEDGEPVQFGDEVEDGTIREIAFLDDGTIILLDETPETIYEASAGWFIKRPEPKVLDADGVEIRVGDMIYSTQTGVKLTVIEVVNENGHDLRVRFDDGTMCYAMGKFYTHREPDSLQRVQQLASDWAHEDNLSNSSAADFRDVMEEIANRLTAIMERDA